MTRPPPTPTLFPYTTLFRSQTIWPASSSIGDLLRREGLSEPRRRRRRAAPASQPFLAATAPNEVWCADFRSEERRVGKGCRSGGSPVYSRDRGCACWAS